MTCNFGGVKHFFLQASNAANFHSASRISLLVITKGGIMICDVVTL